MLSRPSWSRAACLPLPRRPPLSPCEAARLPSFPTITLALRICAERRSARLFEGSDGLVCFFLLVSVALEACLLRRRPLGGGHRFEPLIGNLLATFDGASVGAFDKSLLRTLNSGELGAQVIGLSLVEFLFVELRRGIRHLVLPSQLFPAGNAESSERPLDPDALAAKKVSGSFELHLVGAVLQTACRRQRARRPAKYGRILVT